MSILTDLNDTYSKRFWRIAGKEGTFRSQSIAIDNWLL